MSHRVYIATSRHHVAEARAVASQLRRAGLPVVSRWLDTDVCADESDLAAAAAIAAYNRHDLRAADALLIYATPEIAPKLQSTLWEIGFAFARAQRLVCVGRPADMPLMAREDVTFVDDVAAAIALLVRT